jgi:TolB protein
MRPDGTAKKQLTKAIGYDGGPVFSRDGKKMVWRANYPKTPEDMAKYKSLLAENLTAPMKMELVVADSDGRNARTLTSFGCASFAPTFTPDGKKLVWRANYPKSPQDMDRYQSLLKENLTAPMKMEIVVADADGSNAKTVTDFGCASFAPTFTRDGKKILFASNKHECDGRKFELFLMNLDGSGLEQVTNFGGFTSFPEFAPDGKRIVFVSDKDAKERYEFNVFTAAWK